MFSLSPPWSRQRKNKGGERKGEVNTSSSSSGLRPAHLKRQSQARAGFGERPDVPAVHQEHRARAIVQSRFTVAGDRPSAIAVSRAVAPNAISIDQSVGILSVIF
jgi:hypothetical protein